MKYLFCLEFESEIKGKDEFVIKQLIETCQNKFISLKVKKAWLTTAKEKMATAKEKK